MRVLCVLSSNDFSGAENVVCQIIQSVRNEKNIEIAYCSREGRIRRALAERNIPFVPLRNMSLKELKRVCKEWKPDVIHAHDMRASVYCAFACGRIPVISHIHNNAFDSRKISLKSVAYLLAGFKIKHIFWVSKSAFEGYVFNKLFRSKSEVLYNVISIDALYEKMRSDKKTYPYDIVYVGRLTYPKNPERLMKILKIVTQQLPDVKIAVVGTGDLEQETKVLAKKLQLEHHVDFLGFCSNPLKLMYDAKVMVMASRWEGTPMCVLEAMSLGLPIVSTPTDGVKELITNDVTGFLSEDDNVLADKVVKIISVPENRKQLSAAIKEKAVQVNDIEKYKNKVLTQYRRFQ